MDERRFSVNFPFAIKVERVPALSGMDLGLGMIWQCPHARLPELACSNCEGRAFQKLTTSHGLVISHSFSC
jgi:hypothetical protein